MNQSQRWKKRRCLWVVGLSVIKMNWQLLEELKNFDLDRRRTNISETNAYLKPSRLLTYDSHNYSWRNRPKLVSCHYFGANEISVPVRNLAQRSWSFKSELDLMPKFRQLWNAGDWDWETSLRLLECRWVCFCGRRLWGRAGETGWVQGRWPAPVRTCGSTPRVPPPTLTAASTGAASVGSRPAAAAVDSSAPELAPQPAAHLHVDPKQIERHHKTVLGSKMLDTNAAWLGKLRPLYKTRRVKLALWVSVDNL